MKRIISFLLVALAATTANARPVTYTDGWMAMGMHDSEESSAAINYSPTPQYSVGMQSTHMRANDSGDEDWMHLLTYNRLLKRWNGQSSQGNLFLLSGAGIGEFSAEQKGVGMLGMEADWETRRYYISYENRGIYGGSDNRMFNQRARVGIAPYEGGYDDVHSWIMLQFDHRPEGEHSTTITPLIRLFTTELLGELGISNHKDILFNLTYQF